MPDEFYYFGKNTAIISNKIVVRNKSRVYVGDNNIISINVEMIVDDNCNKARDYNIKINNNSFINSCSKIEAQNYVEVGNKVIIGPYTYISDMEHEYFDYKIPIRDQGIKQNKNKVIVKDGAWIGAGVKIVGDISIGYGTIVAANSVVKMNVPDHCVVAGSPAKVIKICNYKFNEWINVKNNEQLLNHILRQRGKFEGYESIGKRETMMDNALVGKELKENIKLLIENGSLEEAKVLIQEYKSIISNDLEIYSIDAVILLLEGSLDEAEQVLLKGKSFDENNFDINYNLAYIYNQKNKFEKSYEYYKKSLNECTDEEIKKEINIAINNLQVQINSELKDRKKKIAIFVKQGMDSFIGDIISGLQEEYEVKKIVVTDFKQIDDGMNWADICWFEWCDELVIYGSNNKLALEKVMICRLHSYEAFIEYPSKVRWNNIDKVIVVGTHIGNFIEKKFEIDRRKIEVIPNGIDIRRWTFNKRKPGFKIAYVGYINYKKGPMLLLHTFKAIFDKENRYKLHIAGKFQDDRDVLYFEQMIEELGLKNSVIFEGWQDNLDEWLEDKNSILCTSILESQNISIMQAMSKGIKPIIHNFVGAKSIYPEKYIWNTIEEAVEMIIEEKYNSDEYRNFIEDKYLLKRQIIRIKDSINSIQKITNKNFDYRTYWNNRLNNKFDIEGVGYIGLGKIYNNYLYKNRLEILDYILKNILINNRNLSVLELGPGIGIFTRYFNGIEINDYKAIDISKKSIDELSKQYKEYKFINGDISKSEYYDKKYHLIFAADVLLHVTNENNYKATILNISKSLNDDGICILLDPISILNTKSESEHVIIRDIEYVKSILEDNNLELVQMLPVAFFMNYPFDKKLLGDNEETVLNLFQQISYAFSSNELSDEEKDLLGRYLLNKERQILNDKNFGLSEKLLIIKKHANKHKYDMVKINDIWDKNELLREEKSILKADNISNGYINDFNNLISELYKDNLTIDYLISIFNKFLSYNVNNYNDYDFTTAKIMLGKREKVNEDFELIETILTNNSEDNIIINNVWYNTKNGEIIYPENISCSKNFDYINKIIKNIIEYKLTYNNNIAGFIFDEKFIKDINENYLAYIWERGIPASHFMPALGYLKIAERYVFAGTFISKQDKVLEAPCGFGYGAAYFSKLCASVEALDLAEDNIQFSQATYNFNNINWINGDVTKLSYENNEFDVYVSYEVFEHLSLDMVETYLQEAKRVVKPCGKFIISTPNRENRKNVNNPFHIKEYNFEEFDKLIKKYFNEVEYYSVSNFKVEKGMSGSAFNMIAVCKKD